MKKLSYFLLLTVAFILGCEKINTEDLAKDDAVNEGYSPEVIDSIIANYVLPDMLYASVTDEDEQDEGDPQTRTYVNDDKVLWQNGDAISYFGGNIHNTRYTYTGEDGASSVELSLDENNKGATGAVLLKSQAVYPYNKNITVVYDEEQGIDKINLVYPTTQVYAQNSFGKEANIMVAAGSNNIDENLYFRNACGYLIIKLYGKTNIKSITLSSVSGVDKIAGPAVVVASNDAAPVITMADTASTAVTLDCSNGGAGIALGADAEHATEFWFCLPPVTFTDGIKITVTDINDNTYTKQTSKTVEITRNNIQPMAALEFVSNTPSATKLWYTRSDDQTTPLAFYDGKTNPFDATIKANGHYFDETAGMFVIEFSSPLTTIQTEAFRETDLTTITIPEGVTTIEEGAFRNTPLTEITIPGSVNNVGIDVFWECASLSRVTFLPSPTKTPLNIGYTIYASDADGPFYYSPLTTINLNRDLVLTDDDGDAFTPNDWGEGLFANKHYDEEAYKNQGVTVTLGSQVTTLSDYMFYGLPMQTLTIPGTLKTIGNCVFDECEALTSLTYEPSPTGEALTHGYNDDNDDDGPFYASPLISVNLNREIDYTYSSSAGNASEGLFGNKTTLTSVTIGEQVRTLSPYMFANAAIAELVIPGTLTTIQNDVFHGCTELATLTFEPSPSRTALTMGYDTNNESENLFQDNNKLATLNLNREINYTFAENDINSDSEGLFGGMSTLTSVTLGEQVETLHKYMFAGSGITNLVIPGTVNTIANDVFHNCNALTTLTFNPSPSETDLTMGYDTYGEAENLFQNYCPLTTLNLNREINHTFAEKDIDSDSEGLFGGMSTLTSVTLGDQVKTLHKYMFAGSGITSLDLNKVETIDDFALAGVGFTELTIPGTLTTIGNNVFDGCKALTSLTFDPSTTEEPLTLGYDGTLIDEGPFYELALTELTLNRQINYPFNGTLPGLTREGAFASKSGSLKEITLGDQVTNLTAYMFGGAGISSINLNKVKTIEQGAFCNTSIESITIPSTVESVGINAFWGCEKLSTVNIQDGTDPLTFGSQFYQNVYGPFYDSPLTNIHLGREITYTGYASPNLSPTSWDAGFFATEEKVDRVTATISDNVKTISNYMFAHLNLHSITIPASVTSIGGNAFIDCDALTSATISSSTLGSNMFDNCDNLATVTIDGTLDAINMDSFTGCSKLSTLNISGSLGSIGDGTFDGFNLTSLNISGHVGTIGARAFDDNDKMTSFTVTGSVGTIGQYVFNDCDMLATVNVTGTVGTVSSYAFSDCDAVTTLAIPATTVEAYAYEDMDGLLSATLYGTTVGNHVFYDCNYLQTLVIDGGVTSIGNNAFDQCNRLSSVTFESSSEVLHIGFQDETSDKGTFYDSPLTSISLDRELVYDYDDLDYWDEGIFATPNYDDDDPVVTVTLGSNVKTILPWMFSGVRMETVEIPNSVTYIGKRAFSYCYILREVSCRNTTPPTLGEDVFLNDKDQYNNNLTIKVPYNSNIYNEYCSKWSQYSPKVVAYYAN